MTRLVIAAPEPKESRTPTRTEAPRKTGEAAPGNKRLGPRALKVFQDAEAGRAAIYASSLVLAEGFDAAHRGLIKLKDGSDV